MPVKPYPSNLIIFNIDSRILTEDVKLSIRRSWTHIGEILVHPYENDPQSKPMNFIHVMVKFGTRHYLNSALDEADENWNTRMEQHLLSTMRKISNNNIAFNRHLRNSHQEELILDYLEFELEGGALTLEYRLDSNGCVPTSCAQVATEIRNALNANMLGNPCCIRIPSHSSFDAQQKAYEERAKQTQLEDASLMQTNDVSNDGEQPSMVEALAEEGFIEAPELVEEIEQEETEAKRSNSPLEVAPLSEEEWEALYGVNEANFEIDYHIWEIVYADGTSREFDSSTQQYLA